MIFKQIDEILSGAKTQTRRIVKGTEFFKDFCWRPGQGMPPAPAVKPVTILRDRRGGETRPLSLAALRARIDGGEKFGQYVATCACFTQHAMPFMN